MNDRDEVLEQRLEWALRESEGGAVPPDVAKAVSARFAAGEVVAIDDEIAPRRSSRWLTAAVMLLGMGVVAGVAIWQRNGAASAPMQQPQEPKPLPGGTAVTRLVYDLSHEELDRLLVQRRELKPDDVATDLVDVVRRRLGDAAKVQRLRGTMFEVLAPGNDEAIRALRARIEQGGRLEMCIVATDDFVEDNVRFNLTAEKKRLQDWLNQGGREAVLAKWTDIERFNDDPDKGPIARPWLRWVPHLIEPQIDHPDLWDRPDSFDTQQQEGISPLGAATVAVFDQQRDWNGGRVPAAMQKPENEKQKPFLLEFVALNYKERQFHGEDLDPSKVQPGVAEDGRLAVNFELKPWLTSDYADWSARYIKKHSAIVLNGVIRSAPYFVTRIPGRGRISGAFTKDEVEALVSCLRSGEMPVPLVLLRTEQVPAPK